MMTSNRVKVYSWETSEDIDTIEFVSDDFNDVPKSASYIMVMDRTRGAFEVGHTDYEWVAREVALLTNARPNNEFRYSWDFRPAVCFPPAKR